MGGIHWGIRAEGGEGWRGPDDVCFITGLGQTTTGSGASRPKQSDINKGSVRIPLDSAFPV